MYSLDYKPPPTHVFLLRGKGARKAALRARFECSGVEAGEMLAGLDIGRDWFVTHTPGQSVDVLFSWGLVRICDSGQMIVEYRGCAVKIS